MPISSFLTVDLDYWMTFGNEAIASIYTFLEHIYRQNKPITVVKYHHEILLKLHQFSFDRLINVDFHSDITDLSVEFHHISQFNEGTWVNFVNKKNRNEFIWHHPSQHIDHINQGKCHGAFDVFDSDQKVGWPSIKMIHGLPNYNDIKRCCGYCICVSPNWLPESSAIPFVEILADIGFIRRAETHKYSTPDNETKLRRISDRIYNSIQHIK